MMAWLISVRKALVAPVTGLIGWAIIVVQSPSGPITAPEWMGLVAILATALGVYVVPNAIP